MYEIVTKSQHQNLSVVENGFIINPEWPYNGASPDGIVCCLCCGKDTLEIKCPYCHQGEEIHFAVQQMTRSLLKRN